MGDYARTTKDGFKVERRHVRVFRNGYSAWDGWRNDPFWVVTTPAGAEYRFSSGHGFMSLVRRAEQVVVRLKERRIRTERGLERALEKAGIEHNGLGGELHFALYMLREKLS